jgi:hypothetical protein
VRSGPPNRPAPQTPERGARHTSGPRLNFIAVRTLGSPEAELHFRTGQGESVKTPRTIPTGRREAQGPRDGTEAPESPFRSEFPIGQGALALLTRECCWLCFVLGKKHQ